MPKPHLFLTGPRTGAPTLKDLLALFRQMTGREPTPTEIADAEQEFNKKS